MWHQGRICRWMNTKVGMRVRVPSKFANHWCDIRQFAAWVGTVLAGVGLVGATACSWSPGNVDYVLDRT